MATTDWAAFLARWSADLLLDDELAANLPAEVAESGWLGFAGASRDEIASLEARLGVTLPPSYRTFLETSDGWRLAGYFIREIWPTDEVGWFATRHQDWVNAFAGPNASESISDKDYLVYGEEQSTVHVRTEYLQTALQISDVGDSAVYLLNPKVVTPEGEWEAWFFANWLPGATRYPSFREMMEAEYERFLRLRDDKAVREPGDAEWARLPPDPSTVDPRGSADETSRADVVAPDACHLLTRSEVEAVLGAPMVQAESGGPGGLAPLPLAPRGRRALGAWGSSCVYVEVERRNPTSIVQLTVNLVLTRDWGQPRASRGTPPGSVARTGVGDDEHEALVSFAGSGFVAARKGSYTLSMSVSCPTMRSDVAAGFARTVLDRLPPGRATFIAPDRHVNAIAALRADDVAAALGRWGIRVRSGVGRGRYEASTCAYGADPNDPYVTLLLFSSANLEGWEILAAAPWPAIELPGVADQAYWIDGSVIARKGGYCFELSLRVGSIGFSRSRAKAAGAELARVVAQRLPATYHER